MSEQSAAELDALASRVEELVRHQPLPPKEIVRALRGAVTEDQLDEIIGELLPDRCLELGNLVGHADLVLGEAVQTHRITRDELRHGYLAIEPDLALLCATWAPRRALLGGGSVVLTTPMEVGSLERPPHETVMSGPSGWLRGLSPGDLVGLAWLPDRLAVVDVDAADLVEDDVCDVLAAAFDDMVDGDGVADTWTVAARAALRRPGLWRKPRPPLIELLARTGLCVDDQEVARCGFDWDLLWSTRSADALGSPWSDLVLDDDEDGTSRGGDARILPFGR